MPAWRDPVERFWEKVDKSGECWEWTASKNANGYGAFALSRRKIMQAHRVSYELVVGPIPVGLTIDHLCRNRTCVNPDHLEAVTFQENQRRRKNIASHCPSGHEYTEANTYVAPSGYRSCRKCNTACTQRMRARKKAAA